MDDVATEAPPTITSKAARKAGIEWDIEGTDIMSIAMIAEHLDIKRPTLDVMISRARGKEYRATDGMPAPLVMGIYATASIELWSNPAWRPTVGATGRVWAEHHKIIIPVADDVIGIRGLSELTGKSESAIRAAFSNGMRTPTWAAQMPAPLLRDSKLRLWSKRAVDALRLDELDD